MDFSGVQFKHKGAWSELHACLWLLSQGYDVFRNISQAGYADIVAMKDGNVHLFDVKTSYYVTTDRETGQRLSEAQIAAGVVKLCVFPDGKCKIEWNPKPSKKDVKVECKICQRVFKQRRETQLYCSNYCRDLGRPRNAHRRSAA